MFGSLLSTYVAIGILTPLHLAADSLCLSLISTASLMRGVQIPIRAMKNNFKKRRYSLANPRRIHDSGLWFNHT